MVDKIREFFKPIDEIQMSEIAVAVVLAFLINIVLSVFSLNGVGITLAALAILADGVIALFGKNFGRIFSKVWAYLLIILISAGLAYYTSVTSNFVFIALLAFSFTEIVGTIRKTLKI
jgi:hypothetical protein